VRFGCARASIEAWIEELARAPVNQVPGTQVVLEDASLVLSDATGNALSIRSVEAGNLEVSLAVGNGALSLATVSGLTFSVGDGTDDAELIFSASPSATNAALDGLRFAPDPDFSGLDALARHHEPARPARLPHGLRQRGSRRASRERRSCAGAARRPGRARGRGAAEGSWLRNCRCGGRTVRERSYLLVHGGRRRS
jgi:hypothetical protein